MNDVVRPQQLFEFTQRVPLGDRHDAQFLEHARVIEDISRKLSEIRRSDGKLANGSVLEETLDPALLEDLRQRVSEPALAAATSAVAHATQALDVLRQAQDAVAQARAAQAVCENALRQVQAGADMALAHATNALAQLEDRQRAVLHTVQSLDLQNDASLHSAESAENWSIASWHWAEYMPGPLPAETVAMMGISGEHWSARWWANQAAVTLGGKVGEAPFDGQTYGRRNANWVALSASGGGGGIEEAPTDGLAYARRGQGATWRPALEQFLPTVAVPASNGQLVIEATNNGQLTFLFRGSDGVVRSFEMPVVAPPDPAGGGGDGDGATLDFSLANNVIWAAVLEES